MCEITGANAENACCVLYELTLQSNMVKSVSEASWNVQ